MRHNPRLVGFADREEPTMGSFWGEAYAVVAAVVNHFAYFVTKGEMWAEMSEHDMLDPAISDDFEYDVRRYIAIAIEELTGDRLPGRYASGSHQDGFIVQILQGVMTPEGEVGGPLMVGRLSQIATEIGVRDIYPTAWSWLFEMGAKLQTWIWLRDEVVDREKLARLLFGSHRTQWLVEEFGRCEQTPGMPCGVYREFARLVGRAEQQGVENLLLIREQAHLASLTWQALLQMRDAVDDAIRRGRGVYGQHGPGRPPTDDEMRQRYEEDARLAREAGDTIDIDTRFPTVAITRADGTEYFFQGEEADNLLEEVPDWINAEDYILAMAQNW